MHVAQQNRYLKLRHQKMKCLRINYSNLHNLRGYYMYVYLNLQTLKKFAARHFRLDKKTVSRTSITTFPSTSSIFLRKLTLLHSSHPTEIAITTEFSSALIPFRSFQLSSSSSFLSSFPFVSNL